MPVSRMLVLPFPRAGFRLVLLLTALLGACGKVTPAPEAGSAAHRDAAGFASPVRPLPEHVDLDPAKVRLGHLLFLDRRLSADGTVSCATCHRLDHYGVDGLGHSIGVHGRTDATNAPTVFNSGLNFRQFWNGRAATLEEQVSDAVTDPNELGADWAGVVARLDKDPNLEALSTHAYGHGLDAATVQSAIATFERSLITPDAPFDRYLRGDTHAISASALQGWKLFQKVGCISCHQGIGIGGNMYAKLGIVHDYFADRTPTQADLGRYSVTGRPEDKYEFKVPSLRNVAMTAPYLHDGSAKTLDQAIDAVARVQLGLKLDPQQRGDIAAFLKSLTGQVPATAK